MKNHIVENRCKNKEEFCGRFSHFLIHFCSGIFYYASAHLPICKEKHPKIYKDKMGSYVARDEYEKGSEIRFF